MTVIATDGVTIAADGQTTINTFVHRSLPKIKVHKNAVYAACGLGGMLDALIDWHCAGARADKLPPGAFTLFVCDGTTVTAFDDEAPYGSPLELPWAIGSGGEVALGAMLHGATPIEAVRISCLRHTHAGEPFQVIDIKEALGIREPALRAVKG